MLMVLSNPVLRRLAMIDNERKEMFTNNVDSFSTLHYFMKFLSKQIKDSNINDELSKNEFMLQLVSYMKQNQAQIEVMTLRELRKIKIILGHQFTTKQNEENQHLLLNINNVNALKASSYQAVDL